MPYTFVQRITLAVVPRLASLIILALDSTLRYENVFPPSELSPIAGDDIPPPAVYAFWHRSLLTAACRFRKMHVAILISQSFDGELVARTVERLGFRVVRGSSTRGGTLGLLQMAEAYREGYRCAMTADGPLGPAMRAKTGVAQLARLVEAPWVGAFDAFPQRAWKLKTWDGFLIPKPFSKVYISFPAHVPVSDSDLHAQVQAALEEAVQLAESAYRGGRS